MSTSSLLEMYLKMSHQKLYSSFMDAVQDELSIRAVPKKYGSQSRLVKDFVRHFESTQQDRISNKQKNQVKNINQHQIYQWACDHLSFQIVHKSYNDWEL